MADLLFNDSIE